MILLYSLQVRFLSDLVNCRVVNVTSVLAMFDDFVEVTLEDDIPQVRSDWFVYVVLSSLPWVSALCCFNHSTCAINHLT